MQNTPSSAVRVSVRSPVRSPMPLGPPPTPNTLAALQMRVNLTLQSAMDKLKAANDDKKRMTQTIEHLHSQLVSLQSSLALRSSGDELVLKVAALESDNSALREEVHQQSSLIKELDEDAGRLALEGEESASVIQVRVCMSRKLAF